MPYANIIFIISYCVYSRYLLFMTNKLQFYYILITYMFQIFHHSYDHVFFLNTVLLILKTFSTDSLLEK